MNREDVIRMAQEAGLWEIRHSVEMAIGGVGELERFAALVASVEREECKKLCTWKTGNQFVDEAIAVCYRAIDQRGQA
jgi:hypothetical protein